MKRELAFRRWAALAYVIPLLSVSPLLSMALCIHQSHHLRSSSYALRHYGAIFATPPPAQRRLLRRRRAAGMLHSESCEESSSMSPDVSARQLSTAMDKVLPFGRCVGVALPSALTDDVMRAAEEELLPEEIAYCLGLPTTLQLGFLGGRLAIRRALNGMKGAASAAAASLAILHNQHGAPVLPEGVSASISHKRHMAVALVQLGCEGHIGVDIELPATKRRLDLRRRVLTRRECDSLGGVAGMTEQEEVLLRFSVKEAVYKAAHPYLHRPLGFKDVEVHPITGGGCEVNTSSKGAWGDLHMSAGWISLPDVLGQPLFLSYCKAVDGTVSSSSSNDTNGGTNGGSG
ncbi:unnamed protein product, partial [Hapterophycus canaliculatus]